MIKEDLKRLDVTLGDAEVAGIGLLAMEGLVDLVGFTHGDVSGTTNLG